MDGIATLAQTPQHGSHPVQFNLSFTTFIFFQALADNQNILIAGHSNAEPRAISKYLLRSAWAVFPFPSAIYSVESIGLHEAIDLGMPVDAIQLFVSLENPSYVADCQVANVELFVS